jgi:3-oxoacyl-[acyl-carrier protein] reductase
LTAGRGSHTVGRMESLRGRAALVTGGSRGIGRAVALLFARLGARVAIGYARDREAADGTVRDARASGVDAFAIAADLGRAGEGERLVSEAVERLGGLDVAVVNHGIWKHAPSLEMTPEQWDETMRVNLTSAWTVCQQAARVMVPAGRGAIVTIASTAGQRGEAEHAHYAASKGALIALTRSLGAELGPRGIRVNCVAPGWVVTDMSRDALVTPQGEASLKKIPRGTPGTPEEIAAAVAFLASDRASYVYGEVLSVNGGAVMYD